MRSVDRECTGFSLIEIMIVLVIAASVIATGLTWLSAERKRSARGDAIATQALEMATIGRALDQYLRRGAVLPPSGNAITITAEELQAARLLPESYSVRDQFGPDPSSPLGQPYQMLALRSADQAHGLVLAVGAPNDAVMSRMGIKSNEAALGDYQAAVSRQMRSQQYVASAFVRAGTAAADRFVSTFDYDFSAWIGGVVSHPTSIALVGFPEFSAAPDIKVSIDPESLPGGGNSGGNGGGSDGINRFCYASQTGICPANYEAVFKYTLCDRWNHERAIAGEPRNATVRTVAGDIRLERTEVPSYSTLQPYNVWTYPTTFTSRVSTSSGSSSSCNDCSGRPNWAGAATFYTTTCTANTAPFTGMNIIRSAQYCHCGSVYSGGDPGSPATCDGINAILGREDLERDDVKQASRGALMIAFADQRYLRTGSMVSPGNVVTQFESAQACGANENERPVLQWEYSARAIDGRNYHFLAKSLSQPDSGNGANIRLSTGLTYRETLYFGGTAVGQSICEESKLSTNASETLLSSLSGQTKVVPNACPSTPQSPPRGVMAVSAKPLRSSLSSLAVCCAVE